jgi:hypothetical protein
MTCELQLITHNFMKCAAGVELGRIQELKLEWRNTI